MRWPWRKRADSAPPLSDAEMAKLHEEIFEEPVSIERLFAIYESARGLREREWVEWVMDRRMFNRIRQLCLEADGSPAFAPTPPGAVIQLIGLPIAVEPFAKLAIRRRADPAPSDASPGSGAAPKPLAATPRDG